MLKIKEMIKCFVTFPKTVKIIKKAMVPIAIEIKSAGKTKSKSLCFLSCENHTQELIESFCLVVSHFVH